MSESFNNSDQNCTESNCCAPTQAATPSVRPEFNVKPNEAGVTISVDLPGITADQLSVTTEKQQIKVKANRNDNTPAEWTLLNQVERPAAYSLKLNVHRDLDLTKIKAKFANGILHVAVAKRADTIPKKIQIDGAS